MALRRVAVLFPRPCAVALNYCAEQVAAESFAQAMAGIALVFIGDGPVVGLRHLPCERLWLG